MSRSGGQSSTPRAVIHKRILDIAESEPSASMEEIADEIGGASTELVERVLEQYGDPAEEEQGSQQYGEEQDQETTETPNGHTMDEQDDQDDGGEFESTRDASELGGQPDENGRIDEAYSELTDKQLQTLRVIEEQPAASQSDLADEFDVTRATISRWLNDIPGFEWTRREELASEILNGSEIGETAEQVGVRRAENRDPLHQRLDSLERRIDQLEDGLETDIGDDQMRDGSETESGGIEPELAHKVVHASMQYDQITEGEELRLLKQLMG